MPAMNSWLSGNEPTGGVGEVNGLMVERGRAITKKMPDAPLRGRCDSFVAETGVHHPTDVGLPWNVMPGAACRETPGSLMRPAPA